MLRPEADQKEEAALHYDKVDQKYSFPPGTTVESNLQGLSLRLNFFHALTDKLICLSFHELPTDCEHSPRKR